METYAQALTIAIPFFLTLILIEELVARYKAVKVNRSMDTISSLSSGVTNTLKEVMGLSLVIFSYQFLVEHIALFNLEANFLAYIIAFIGIDFAGYWSHRLDHRFNILWNRHIVHHSSEEFNLSCALRQPVSNIIKIYFFLYIPIAMLGVPMEVIAITAPLHLFVQFWYHTRLIDKMGWLEYIIVTPSHHRVHHAINPEYIDKNFSQVFIVWDKIFGTFQEELKEKPPVFGITRPVQTWNPILINLQHLWLLITDAFKTKNWKDKFLLFYKPTGYRPEDVAQASPVFAVKDPYTQEKYQTNPSLVLSIWSWIQLLLHNVFLLHLLTCVGDISSTSIIYYACFLMVSTFAYTSLMDKVQISVYAELMKFGAGIVPFIFYPQHTDNLFSSPYLQLAMIAYLCFSLFMSFYLLLTEPKPKKLSLV